MRVSQVWYGVLILGLYTVPISGGRVVPIVSETVYGCFYELYHRVDQLHRDIIKASNEGKNPENVYNKKIFEQEYQALYNYYNNNYRRFKHAIEEERHEMLEEALKNLNDDLHGITQIGPWMIDVWNKALQEQNARGES